MSAAVIPHFSSPQKLPKGTMHGSAVNSRAPSAGSFQESPARKFHGNTRGIFRGNGTQNIPAFELTTNDWNKLSAEALNEHMEAEKLTAKELAQKVGCNDRTMENYLQGKTAPSGVNQLRCIAVIPEFQARVAQITAMEREHDPEAMRAMIELQRAAMKWADLRDARPHMAQAEMAV